MSDSDSNIRFLQKLRSMKKTLSLAESCTGGMISKMITDQPGSSLYFRGAVVAYSDEIKNNVLKVDEEILKSHGAVSVETALSMAKGVRNLMNSDIGASCTGIAGPSGSTPIKPVGMVCMAVCDGDFSIVETIHFPGDRDMIRTASSKHLLNMIANFIGG